MEPVLKAVYSPRGPGGQGGGAGWGDILVATASRREGWGGPGLPATRVLGDVLGRGWLLFRAGDGPQSQCPATALSWPRDQHSLCFMLPTGPSTGTSVTKALAFGPATSLPYLLLPGLRGWHGRGAAGARGATPPAAGCSRALAPCWCVALMLSKAYLLLGFYLHPLSLSAAGQPSCLRHVPGACLQQVWSALLFARSHCLRCRLPAVPDSEARADNVRTARTLALAFPMTLPCPPHSSDATHAFARGRGRARRMAVCADGAQAAPGSAGGLFPGGLIDISVT